MHDLNDRRLAIFLAVTRHHAHHHFGFGETQWELFLKESLRRVKPLLYVYRVLLTGIWLMRNRPSMKYQQLRLEFQIPHMGRVR